MHTRRYGLSDARGDFTISMIENNFYRIQYLQSLKYWRYRMYLLPKEHPATKKIMESPVPIPCDIYIENAVENTKSYIEDFMRFVETHLNKLRKNHCPRNTRVRTDSF